jgi:DNA-binding transcriptional regulator YhcF (GntR family)
VSKFTDEWGSFTAIPNVFIAGSERLSDHARWLFVLLRFYTNQESECAWPSYSRLQELTAWSRATISKAIKELEKNGWLERRKRFGLPVVYVLKRRSSSQNELLDNNGPSASSSDSPVVHGMNHSSSQNELQKFTTETTASLHEQERTTKTKLPRRVCADAPRPENKSRVSQSRANTGNQTAGEKKGVPKRQRAAPPKSPFHNHPAVVAYRDLTGFKGINAVQAEMIAQAIGLDIKAVPEIWMRFLRELAASGKKANDIAVMLTAFNHYQSGTMLREAINLAWKQHKPDSTQGTNNGNATRKTAADNHRECYELAYGD